MTITKGQILAHINSELNRTETDIDALILEALKDLSLQEGDFLWVESDVDTIIGRKYYSLPLDYVKLLSIKIDDENSLELIDWGKYQSLIANETTADRNMPDRFCIHAGFWYAYPTPDAIYVAKLYYNAHILESEDGNDIVDNIPYKDIFRNALQTKTKALYCRSKGWISRAEAYEADYFGLALPPLRKLQQKQVRQVQYNDW